MKLLKPSWVSHHGNPIFSVAIHPDGSRFATGGQGKDSGVIVIWNMAPIRSAADEENADIPKSLCEMTNHLGCVNCVRWSVDGKWLASGGDDAIVMIWAVNYQGEGGGVAMSSFGAGAVLERWGCVHMLRGHNGDVLDLSWSPDQKYLATCSVDNSIVVWNARDLPRKISVVTGHSGLVKGLAWDPVGKYLASQSDDKSLRIWRTNDWKEERQITNPFKMCGGTTHILRLSWSPDGKYIISAHALNNDGPTAQIIERGDWKIGVDLVGHRKAIEVASFNPHLFYNSGESTGSNHGCIAVGSRDRSLSIWLTSLKRPLVVTHDLFVDSILDLSWSNDGYELLVSSTDGSIGYVCFSKKELGIPLPKDTLDDLFVSMYGCPQASSHPGLSSRMSDILIEDPAMLRLHKSVGEAKVEEKSTPLPDSASAQTTEMQFNSAKVPTITKQTETRTKDGRRRITPVMLSSQISSLSAAPRPFTSSTSQSWKPTPVESDQKQSTVTGQGGSQQPATSQPSIEKMLLSPPAKPISFEPLSPTKPQSPKVRKEVPATNSPSLTSSSPKSHKRRVDPEADLLPRSKRFKKSKPEAARPAGSKPGTPQKSTSLHSVVAAHRQPSAPLLAVPSSQSSVTVQMVSGSGGSESVTLEVENSEVTGHKIICRRGSDLQWQSSLISAGLLAAGNHCIVCIVSEDRTVSVYSAQSGRLLLSRFSLPAPPHAVQVSGHSFMVVTAEACVRVWNTLKMEAIVPEASFSHLIRSKKGTLQSCTLTSTSVPIISFPDSSYMYHKEMAVWLELSTAGEFSEIRGADPDIRRLANHSAPLEQVQHSAALAAETTASLAALRDRDSRAATLSFLESQIVRSYSLKSPCEYQRWSRSYVQFLVKEGLEGRLREFCMQFCRPGEGLVVGLERGDLLRDFLGVIAGNAKLQRLYCEVRDALDQSNKDMF